MYCKKIINLMIVIVQVNMRKFEIYIRCGRYLMGLRDGIDNILQLCSMNIYVIVEYVDRKLI